MQKADGMFAFSDSEKKKAWKYYERFIKCGESIKNEWLPNVISTEIWPVVSTTVL